jgi:CheY-like chemotaxis protein
MLPGVVRDPFAAGGEMAGRMRRFSWSRTPLGEPAGWAPTLRQFVRFILQSPDPLWIAWGPDGTTLYNDACARRVLGTRHPDALGRRAADVWEDRWPEVQTCAESSPAPAWKRAIRFDAGGSAAPSFLAFSCTPLEDDTTGERGSLWLVTDQTMAVQARREVPTLPADRRLAAIAHQLRTPVHTILAWAQLLAAGVDADDRRRGLDAIGRSTRLLARLLDELTASPGNGAPGGTIGQAREPTAVTAPIVVSGADRRSGADLSRLSILVVDDDDDARLAAARILTGAGARVRAVSSALQALAMIETDAVRPDVIVSDITMPVIDGYEFIRKLRAAGGVRAQVPAIALTSLAAAADRLSAYRAGYQLHVTKPVETDALLDAVATVAGLR